MWKEVPQTRKKEVLFGHLISSSRVSHYDSPSPHDSYTNVTHSKRRNDNFSMVLL